MSFDCLNSISVDQLTLGTWLTMSFQDVDVLYVVFWSKNSLTFDSFNRVNNQASKELWISIDKFTRHGCFGTISECFISQTFNWDSEFIFNISTCFSCCNFKAHNDVGRMYFHFDELVGSFKQLSCQNNDWSGTISNFCILQLC